MGPKRKKKDEPVPEMGEGSKISSLPVFVSRHLEVINEQTGAVRVWFSSNNLRVSNDLLAQVLADSEFLRNSMKLNKIINEQER